MLVLFEASPLMVLLLLLYTPKRFNILMLMGTVAG